MCSPNRTGARSPALVPSDVRKELERGAPSVNHMEQIAIDMSALLANVLPELAGPCERLRQGGLVTKMREGGRLMFEQLGTQAWPAALEFESDTVRGWGAMAISACPELSLAERIELIEPFADDPHFAVREWAWLALRPAVAADARQAIDRLLPWTSASSARRRRFASETTRPRGVWSAHIAMLKTEPEYAEPLLEALSADNSAYVQKSVGNWLNDASKSRPDWVRTTCASWLRASEDPATKRICARGMRTLDRAAQT